MPCTEPLPSNTVSIWATQGFTVFLHVYIDVYPSYGLHHVYLDSFSTYLMSYGLLVCVYMGAGMANNALVLTVLT